MARQRIHIENLQIRLPREMAGEAESVAGRLGREIMKSIADAAKGQTGTIRIDQVTVGKLKASGGDPHKQAAAGIAAEVRKRIG